MRIARYNKHIMDTFCLKRFIEAFARMRISIPTVRIKGQSIFGEGQEIMDPRPVFLDGCDSGFCYIGVKSGVIRRPMIT